MRVLEGGHNINPKVIERRYVSGIDIYLDIVDGALVFDNYESELELIANKQIERILNIVNPNKFTLFNNIE